MAKYLDQTGLAYFWGKVKGWVNNSQHPIGSIYISTSASFNPQEAWGGTWEKTADGRCLIGASDAYPLGSTGGEAEHALTVAELARHKHQQRFGNKSGHNQSPIRYLEFDENIYGKTWVDTTSEMESGFTGEGKAHNNMQPFLAVYIWERTA